ncbi:hypothetical protein Clacol_007036 [Clathrus columnatus]|uniref:DUF6699 domain-containing protein n=1 Tax=Clathrus columnatus TaxID=1419009 RepID=A0AAV5AIN3_9AGAM|nr:hypothetical protein Clacol_007036 [Clathrus columnatus]
MSNSTIYVPSPQTSVLSIPLGTTTTSRSRSSRTRPNYTSKRSVLRFLNPWRHQESRVPPQPQSKTRRQRLPSAHTLLTYREDRQEGPLEYDLSLDPSHILVIHNTGYSILSTKQLDTPATNPSVHSMNITCTALPWTMTITASNNNGVLSIRDIIDGLYHGLRSKAKKQDWDRLSKDAKGRVRRAWVSRYNRHHSIQDRAYEKSQGLRRVDFLGGHVAFKGLAYIPDERHWVMHVGPPERRVKFSTNA